MRKLMNNKDAGAIGFVVSMLVLGLVVAALVGTFAYEIETASENESVAGGTISIPNETGTGSHDVSVGGVPGGSAMLMILALLFIIIPVVIFAKAAT